jgi:hypothetical protein
VSQNVLGTERTSSVQDIAVHLREMHKEIQSLAGEDENFLNHAVHNAKVTKGLLLDIVASKQDDV